MAVESVPQSLHHLSKKSSWHAYILHRIVYCYCIKFGFIIQLLNSDWLTRTFKLLRIEMSDKICFCIENTFQI